MPPIIVFRCYLKVFGKMVTEIIILYHKVLQRDLLATFRFIKIDFIMKQCGKKQLHCISQKIFLTAGDSDIKSLVDYIMHYIIKYMFLKTPPPNQMYYLPNHTFSTFNTIKYSFISFKQSNVAFSLLSSMHL